MNMISALLAGVEQVLHFAAPGPGQDGSIRFAL